MALPAAETPSFDPVLLSRARLGVMAMLLARGEATFPELRDGLGLTQGNLGAHLRQLEEAGYVSVDKSFVDRKPRTLCSLTGAGRSALERHVALLETLLAGNGGGPVA